MNIMAVATSSADSLGEVRRAQLLDAAAVVFAEKGYQSATVKDIAALAGVAPGTIYLYFTNKRELLMGIVEQLITQAAMRSLGGLQEMQPEAAEEGEPVLERVLREFWHFGQENQALLRALVGEIWIDANLQQQLLNQVVRPILSTAEHYLRGRVANGKLQPCQPELVVAAVAGSLGMVLALRDPALGGILGELSDDQVVEALSQLFMRGLAPA